MTLWKLLKLQNRDHQASKGNGFFVSGIKDFRIPGVGTSLSPQDTEILLTQGENRRSCSAEWSAVSMRAALGHAETAQLSGSGAQCSARHLLIRWCLSSTRGACRTSQPVELITEPFHLWYSKADLLRKDFVWWFCSLEKVWFFWSFSMWFQCIWE